MVFVLLLSAVGVTLLYNLSQRYRNLQRQLALAKSSGLPYVVSPCYVYSVAWLATNGLFLPVLKRLPASWKGLWLDCLHPDWSYHLGHAPFKQIGSDVFLQVSPGKITAYVADAEAVTQITTRRNDFPKPLELYTSLDLYGRNLVSSEGADWRKHRKLAAPSFGEKNNNLVFVETVHHAQALLYRWTGPDGRGNLTVKEPANDAMRFALYVISRAGFDVRVAWPHEQELQEKSQVDGGNAKDANSMFVGSEAPPGYKLNYRDAISELLHNITWSQVASAKVLSKSPFKIHRVVATALTDWGKYMNELYDTKAREIASGLNTQGMDLFGSLIRASGILEDKTKSQFQRSDILGNAFVLMLAGHETTANALHYSLVLLATHWATQKRLQKDIDDVFQGRPVAEWKYEADFQRLFSGMTAAVMNETLRLYQPITNIPKSTTKDRTQPLNLAGKQYMVPADATVVLSAAVHRNPKYWPAPSVPEPAQNKQEIDRPDVDCFRPERWLTSPDDKNTQAFVDINYDDEDLRGPSGEDTSAALFKPVKGSYIPFSDGFRSCIGRRFAQVELLAVLAVIFAKYSVELAVDDLASDADVDRMPRDGAERRAVWDLAAERADRLLTHGMVSVITLQLRGEAIPIRLVRRGEERFAFATAIATATATSASEPEL